MPRSIILRSLARRGAAPVKGVRSWVHCRRSSQLGHPDCILAASRQRNDEEVIFQYDAWRQGSGGNTSIQAGRPVVGKLLHSAALAACERLSLWSKAAAILQDAALRGALQPDSRPLLDLVSFNLVLGAYAAAHQWEAALDLFIDMQRTVTPDASSYAALMEGCRSARKYHIVRIASKWSKQCFEETLSKINDKRASSRYCYLSLKTLVKRQLWSEATHLLWQLAHAGRALDTELLNIAISAYGHGQQARFALKLLDKAGARLGTLQLPSANLDSFKLAAMSVPVPSVFSPSSSLPGWPEALMILEEASHSRLQPDMQIFTIVAGVCSRAHSWQAALKVLEAARHRCLEWDIFAYNAVLQASARYSVESDVNFKKVWRQLHHQQLSPDGITYGTAIALCDRSHKWAHALHLLSEMQHPTAVCLTSILSACARGSAWELAVHLFWTMPGQWGFRPHAANMVNALHALGKALRWQQACALLSELEWANEHISWQHYFAAADGCGEASEWQRALQLVLEKLPGKFEPPPSYRFSAAIGACKSGLVFLEASGKSTAELRSSSIWETALTLFWSGLEETLLAEESEAGVSCSGRCVCVYYRENECCVKTLH